MLLTGRYWGHTHSVDWEVLGTHWLLTGRYWEHTHSVVDGIGDTLTVLLTGRYWGHTHSVVDWEDDGYSIVQFAVLHLLFVCVWVENGNENRVLATWNGIDTAPHGMNYAYII